MTTAKSQRKNQNRKAKQKIERAQIKRWYSPSEAAEYIGNSPSTLAVWRCKGGGPPFYKTASGAIRYRRWDLEDFVMKSGRLRNTHDGDAE